MALPPFNTLAGCRALDALCADRLSTDSKRTVAQLSLLTLAQKRDVLHVCELDDRGHLVRCLLEAGCPPNLATKRGDEQTPALVWAAHMGSARVVQALLEGGAEPSAKPLLRASTQPPL